MSRMLLKTTVTACMLLVVGVAPVRAQDSETPPAPVETPRRGRVLTVTGTGTETVRRNTLALEAGGGRVLTLGAAATNVFVADPKVAEVRPASPTSLFIFGVSAGRTTVVAMDQNGRSIGEYDVTVRPSAFISGEAEAAVARVLAGSRVRVSQQPRGLLVTGTVGSASDAARVVGIVKTYTAEGQVVENQLSVRQAVQVALKVRVVEMNRNVTRSLGVDWQGLGSIGRFSVAGAIANGLGVGGTAPAGAIRLGTSDISTVIQALSNDNLARVLAEPTLTVLSGEPASFLAGGEYPVPVGQNNQNGVNTITVVFKTYGVSLNFVPTVLSDGRINLHVKPEVSQLTNTGALTLSSGNSSQSGTAAANGQATSSLSIPSITTRRAETTVELGSGQSFAIAGLLSDTTTQTTTAIPFLGELPIIGQFFRSAGFQRQETELVFIITPYIVTPVNDPGALHTPSEKFTPPNDLERIILLRQVGDKSGTVATRIPGQAGFVVQ